MTTGTTVNSGTDRWQVLRLLVSRKTVLISLIVIIVLVAAALLAPWVSPYDPFKLSIMNRLKAPGAAHWFGTDDFGRDVFSRVIYGGRLSLMVGFSVVIVSSVLGIALGLVAGFFRSADKFVSRLIDAMMAFPDILLAISLVAALGPSLINVVIALGIVYTPRLARIGAGHVHLRLRDPGRSRPVVPGRGRIARHPHLGHHDQRRPAIHGLGRLDHDLPRHRHCPVRAVAATGRRRPARRTRPAPAQGAVIMTASTRDVVLSVEGLKTWFHSRDGIAKSVDGVTFDLARGETLAIVGESGSGKSVTSLSIMGLLPKPAGRIEGGKILYRDRQGTQHDLARATPTTLQKIRGAEIAMIFQEPMTSLNPLYTVGDQIAEAVLQHEGGSYASAIRRARDMLERVEIPAADRRVNEYPHQMSGGMRQRVMIALALACNPAVLIADEPTTALDVTVQAQILDLLRRLQKEMNMSILFITHNLGVVAEIAHRVAVMYAGRVVEDAGVYDLFEKPTHPYTRGLLSCLPTAALLASGERLRAIPGNVPSVLSLPAGCTFAPRCELAADDCRAAVPELIAVQPEHRARCIKVKPI